MGTQIIFPSGASISVKISLKPPVPPVVGTVEVWPKQMVSSSPINSSSTSHEIVASVHFPSKFVNYNSTTFLLLETVMGKMTPLRSWDSKDIQAVSLLFMIDGEFLFTTTLTFKEVGAG